MARTHALCADDETTMAATINDNVSEIQLILPLASETDKKNYDFKINERYFCMALLGTGFFRHVSAAWNGLAAKRSMPL